MGHRPLALQAPRAKVTLLEAGLRALPRRQGPRLPPRHLATQSRKSKSNRDPNEGRRELWS